jgi:hypothetical protein
MKTLARPCALLIVAIRSLARLQCSVVSTPIHPDCATPASLSLNG